MMTTEDRHGLQRVSVDEALGGITSGGRITLTISVGQPLTTLHRVGYDMGCYLLELDDDEQPVCAYHREVSNGELDG
jgi:hypothetical protein